ncbi:sterol desaturase family protein [Parvularcula sp. LCG005]|uniref:sterol desaturase family protein n=1 Tax=Parvularcula sp. LCG005 TaxID=3078805 RepID=UPI0029437F3A|nr:sterol desaturase family protein [Parvularcula sp. LCG005]WOI54579.1 sterol desaturase family protein [Parvularcula sp. LCG005]
MSLFIKILLVFGTTAAMEFTAWWAHKYIMHGWGWDWHKDHHEPHNNLLEKNDYYAVVFSVLSIVLFGIGTFVWAPLFYIALGILLYGIIYTVIHDGLVHQRYPWKWVPKKGYFKRVVQAHKIHHAVQTKEGAVSFGFVWAMDPHKLKDQLRTLQGRHRPGASVTAGSAETKEA